MVKAFPRREEKHYMKSLCLGLKEMQREISSKHPSGTSASAYAGWTGNPDSTRQKTIEKKKWFGGKAFFTRKKEQCGCKIVHFHNEFILSLGLQAVLSY